MKSTLTRRTAPFTLLLACVFCAEWGRDGHKIASTVAEAHLTPEAKAAVTQLLAGQFPADVSTWADEIRSDPAYRWASPLHYANVQLGAKAFDLKRDCPDQGCVVSAIIKYTSVLRSREATVSQKTEALKSLIHFVEDVHQPLHVSRARHRGGDDVKVEFFDDRTNLPRVWDSGLIRRTKKSWTAYAAEIKDALTPEQIKAWSGTDPVAWATESYQLDQAYFDRCIPVVNRCLAMAGVRLAAVLNKIFSESAGATVGSEANAVQERPLGHVQDVGRR